LGSVSSDRILPKLAPGINVLTIHPRYWSFYAFVLDEFWRRDLPRSRAAYVAFYRPREAIFALGAQVCDRPEHDRYGRLRAVVGAQKSAGYAQTHDEFDPAFEYMESDLGGYGLYYATTMEAMGVIALAAPGAGLPYDAPTPEGKAVADAFRQAVAGTRYYQEYFDDPAKPVPSEVAVEYLRAACLCQLQTEAAPDRALLRDVFLHYGAGPDDAATRRATLRFFLDLAAQTDGTPLDEDTFRQLIYFRAEMGGATYKPRHGIEHAARRWRLYQAREYYAYALNRLWQHLCSWGLDVSIGGSRPVPLSDVWAYVESALDVGLLTEAFEVRDPGLDASTAISDLLVWVSDVGNTSADLDAGWDIDAVINEHSLYRWCALPARSPKRYPGSSPCSGCSPPGSAVPEPPPPTSRTGTWSAKAASPGSP
jgi:hypothetical protein